MRHGSLFSGIGGFDLAAEWMGWENVFHCEWNEFGQKVLKYYWPEAESFTDITKTDFTKYEGTIDLISGGFPCQPFSLAGKRKGKDDERYLWHEMLRAIQEIKPKFVIAENVYGITNIDGGLVFEQVCLDLEAEGYEVQPFIIPAAAKNAPHRRDRCWFVATNTNNPRTNYDIGIDRNGEEENEKRKRQPQFKHRSDGYHGDVANTNCNRFNKGRGYDGISKNVDGSDTSFEWSTNSKDIDGRSSNGVSQDQYTIGSRVSKQANVKKNQTTNSRRICGVDETNKSKKTFCKNGVIIDKSRALVQERQSRFFASINRGLGNNKAPFGKLANMGLSIDLSRINPMDWDINNSNGNGFDQRNGNDEINPSEGRVNAQCNTNTGNVDGDVADTCGIGFQRKGESTKLGRNGFSEYNAQNDKPTWYNFPTQSPICGGDDGLPTELDGITFSKWRTESIKAYGNAIVPQVAYDIFKALILSVNSPHGTGETTR